VSSSEPLGDGRCSAIHLEGVCRAAITSQAVQVQCHPPGGRVSSSEPGAALVGTWRCSEPGRCMNKKTNKNAGLESEKKSSAVERVA
jgi:hypothetical protein